MRSRVFLKDVFVYIIQVPTYSPEIVTLGLDLKCHPLFKYLPCKNVYIIVYYQDIFFPKAILPCKGIDAFLLRLFENTIFTDSGIPKIIRDVDSD